MDSLRVNASKSHFSPGTRTLFVCSALSLVALLLAFRAEQKTDSPKHVVVFDQPGRFGGWPANNGVWTWGDEIVVGFQLAYFQEKGNSHSYDRSKPSIKALARSLDGGESWRIEEHPELGSQKGRPSPGGIEFTNPGFAMKLDGPAFHISYDRGSNWEGPYLLPDFGRGLKLTSRTDYLVTGPQSCLLFLSAKETRVQAGLQDRAFTARTIDGGKTFEFLSWMTGEPLAVRSVMPATVRLSAKQLVSCMRRRFDLKSGFRNDVNWIDAYGSEDNGRSWKFLSRAAYTDLGRRNGNPPGLVRLTDGRLVLTYGYRAVPYGIRAKISYDGGHEWGREIILRDDGRTWDLGYTRSVMRPDGRIVTIYYYTTPERPEQHIAATIWDPDDFSPSREAKN